jgi:4-carboxymuconolactone decarboxylase
MPTREALRQRGEAMQSKLFGVATADPAIATIERLIAELPFGAIWYRSGMALPDRMTCTLAALGINPRPRSLRRHIVAAMTLGMGPRTIQEVLIQSALWAGFAAAEESLAIAAEVFADRGIGLPSIPPDDASMADLLNRGTDIVQALHGEMATEGYAAPDNPVTAALYPLVIQFGYGSIWCRPGLDQRSRTLVSIAGLTAMRLPQQARKFGAAALRVGISKTEVIEAVVQTAPYSGFPPALNALQALSDILK